jgi:four helix bundle protein
VEVQERLTGSAIRVVRLCGKLPKDFAGRHLGGLLFRASTSAAANYAEARGAGSRSDVIHELGLVRKELNESPVWLNILERSGMGSRQGVAPMRLECDALCRIVAARRRTAERNLSVGENNWGLLLSPYQISDVRYLISEFKRPPEADVCGGGEIRTLGRG